MDRDSIRQRPAMYIGSADVRGIHHIVRELLLGACFEVRRGFGGRIGLTLFADGSCQIIDDGRGIPADIDPESGLSWLLKEMTVIPHRGWWEDVPVGNGRRVTEWPGTGAIVATLSEWCQVETSDAGERYRIDFGRGDVEIPLEHLGPTNDSGVRIWFKPDPDIFGSHTFDLRTILHTLCELAFLHAGVRFMFTDKRTGKTDAFHFPDGLIAFVKYLNTGEEMLHEPIRLSGKEGEIGVEVAFQYTTGYGPQERGYANGRYAPNGGTHIAGFRRGLREAFRRVVKNHGWWPNELPVMPEDIRAGVTVAISIDHPNPSWMSATASELGNEDAENAVAKIVREGLSRFLEEHSDLGTRLCKQIALNAEARIAAREALRRQRVSRLGTTEPAD